MSLTWLASTGPLFFYLVEMSFSISVFRFLFLYFYLSYLCKIFSLQPKTITHRKDLSAKMVSSKKIMHSLIICFLKVSQEDVSDSFNQQGHRPRLSSTLKLLKSHITRSAVLSANPSLTSPEKNGCIIVVGKRKTNLTRLPPHSFMGSVFVRETGRIHNQHWHSWNVKSRPGHVFLCLPLITKPNVQQQWLLCFTTVNSFTGWTRAA